MNSQQILRKLVKFNTVEDKDNNGIIKFLADILKPVGFKIQFVKNKKTKKINLLAKYNSKKPVLTFSGHTDTVPATKNWNYKPFDLTCRGGKLYGLGTNDMKGPIASFVSAVCQTNLQGLKKGINLIFTYGEAVNSSGVQDFLKKVRLKTNYIILAGDTGMVPVVASKGAYAIRIEFEGKEPGAEINSSINAILIAQQFIKFLTQYFKKLEKKTNQVFDIPFATVNIAKMFGGDLINRVPGYCCLEFEYRTVDYNQGVKIYQDILEILRTLNCKFKIKLINQIEPMICQNKKFVTELEEITNNKALGFNSSTEATFYNKYGYDCIVLGPGNGLAHQPNEYITKNQLKQSEKIYLNLINKYCN